MSNPMSHSQNPITFFLALVKLAMFPEIQNIYYIIQSISFQTKLRQNRELECNNTPGGSLMWFREGHKLEKKYVVVVWTILGLIKLINKIGKI